MKLRSRVHSSLVYQVDRVDETSVLMHLYREPKKRRRIGREGLWQRLEEVR